MINKFKELEEIIKYKFNSKDILRKSLTHKSYDENSNNEKLEFLGDRVLGLIIAKKLLEIYPNEKEGILDKKFASLVNKNTCLEIAKNIKLENFIQTFNPKNKSIKILKIFLEKFLMNVKVPKFKPTEKKKKNVLFLVEGSKIFIILKL